MICENCKHEIGEKCKRCGKEFLCGVVSAPCPKDDCNERIIDPKYESFNNVYKA